jgi:SAM-dependent methyltransferase
MPPAPHPIRSLASRMTSMLKTAAGQAGDPGLAQRAEAMHARIGAAGGLPAWPEAALQMKYTGASGVGLMRSTLRFVDALEAAGAFAAPGWRGLDYGCGWGRIASVLLTRGGPEQLDLCDAWPQTIEILGKAGFANRVFAVPEVLRPGDIPPAGYDFAYAYSVFTHLRRDVFEQNLAVLLAGLRPGGRAYLTVRHADYLPRIKAKPADAQALARDGFWYRPTGNSEYFGMAVVERSWLERLPRPGAIAYLGEIDPCQHLYAIGA